MSTTFQQPVPRTRLGSLEVPRMGLGCMGMTLAYGRRDPRLATATIHRAIERGVTLLDTADMYANGRNKKLIGAAITGRRDRVILASKCGITTWPLVGLPRGRRADPGHIRRSVHRSLQRLGTDRIDLYYLHRVDPAVPIEESVAAMSGLVAEGLIREIGLSEVTGDELRRAHAVHPIAAVEMEWSILTRDIETELLPTARELQVGVVAYSPISRGMLSGDPAAMNPGLLDFRRHLPRWSPANKPHNTNLVNTIATIAQRHDATPAQIALAWLLHQGHDVIPIPGTSKPSRIDENLGAFTITLTPDDLHTLNNLTPAGDRYGPRGA